MQRFELLRQTRLQVSEMAADGDAKTKHRDAASWGFERKEVLAATRSSSRDGVGPRLLAMS